MKKLLLLLAFIPTFLLAQSKKERKALEAQKKADQVIINNLKNHIQNLTGSNNEQNSAYPVQPNLAEYISSQFKLLGLIPKGTNGYMQPYQVENGKIIELSTYLKVNDKQLEVNKEYFPLSYSAEKKVKGTPAMALRERGVPWFVDLKEWFEDGSKVQGNIIEELVKKETAKVEAKGATALFLYNSGAVADGLLFNSKDKSSPSTIPVIYVTSEGLKKHFHDPSESLDIELNVAFKESNINGTNVVGYIDNAATSTIVLGAHYDKPLTNAIVNPGQHAKATLPGADDNGSGIAMLIELARMLSSSKAKNNNYVFIALGGSDKGSVASNYWLENSSVGTPINYMLNLDMVGSYSDGKKLSVQGFSSSPVWNDIFTAVNDKKVELIIDSDATPTDPLAVFYKKGIPELSFSSATHDDYLTTTDEEVKINYAGILQIAKFISRLVEVTDSKGKLALRKIQQESPTAVAVAEPAVTKPITVSPEPTISTPKTSVSLGVIPDRANNEPGLKISAVSPKKLASKLGLQPGDVLTNLGAYKISDFKTYMHALSNFKAGDKTTLRIKRGKDDKEFAVVF